MCGPEKSGRLRGFARPNAPEAVCQSLFIVFTERENQPFWKVKFSVEDFSCHEIKFEGNKYIFDLLRREKIW